MSDENKNLDEQLDLLFGTGTKDEPAEAEVEETEAEEPVGFDAIEDVTELFRKKNRDEEIPDVTLDFSDDDDEKTEEQEKKPEEEPVRKPAAAKKAEKKPVKKVEEAVKAPEEEDRYEFLDDDDEEEPVSARVNESSDDDEEDYEDDEDGDENGYSGRTRRDNSDNQLKKEYTHFWIFTVIVIVLTAAAVLLILNFRGILDFGFLKKETTAPTTEIETEATSETTISEEPTTAEVTETEAPETETVPAEETSSEETPAEETTSAEADSSVVLNNYANMFVVTGTTTLKLRKEPSTDSEVIGTLEENGGGEVIDTDTAGWIHVKSNALVGYVSADYVLLGDEAKAVAAANAVLAVRVNADTLNIRAEASTDSDIVDYTTKDALLTYEETADGFYKVKNDDNAEGYVSADYCTLSYYLKEAVIYRAADTAQ